MFSRCRRSAGYDSTAAALEGKRELNEEETTRLKQLRKKLVCMFHPDLHEHDPEKRKTYELLTQAINEARDRGDIELLELIAKDPQASSSNKVGRRCPSTPITDSRNFVRFTNTSRRGFWK